jgi:hypothetical protein
MKKFEYKVLSNVDIFTIDMHRMLTECGKEGWELVSTTTTRRGNTRLYLKREIDENTNNNPS